MKIVICNVNERPSIVNKWVQGSRDENNNQIMHLFVGRPSPLGNPYKMGKLKREQAVAKFDNLCDRQASKLPNKTNNTVGQILTLIEQCKKKEIAELRLYCYCSPKLCHAKVIKKYILLLTKNAAPGDRYKVISDRFV